MSRILYLSFNDPRQSLGVFQKEQQFCNVFGRLCSDRGSRFAGLCIVASPSGGRISQGFGRYFALKTVPSVLYTVFSRVPLFGSIFRIRPVFSQAYRDIDAFAPDVILWRYSVTSVPGVFDPKAVRPEAMLITEHQAKEIEELRMSLPGLLVSPLIWSNGKRVLEKADAVIGVTTEIAEYERALTGKDIPCFTMTNSITVQDYPLKSHVFSAGNTIRLLYVGSHTASWQGLDRLLRGMATYRGERELQLHLAGSTDSSTRTLVSRLDITDRVVFHGYLMGKPLDDLFDLCDVAVGTLGIHRKQLRSGSTLKVREYMARGIPFIISYEDEDITPGLPYVLQAPADDSPIDLGAIIRFIDRLRLDMGQELPGSMRRYAQDHMDYRIKASRLLAFIEKLCGQGAT